MSIPPLLLDGASLTIAGIVAVARHRRRVAIAPEAMPRIDCCRALVEVLVEAREVVYGLTTGFGKLRDVVIPADKTRELQVNLIRSHAAGVGRPLAEDVVRAVVLLRANTLCKGNSGVRREVIETLLAMLNDDVYPFVPEKGSVGASGDLIPLAHLALFLIGDPEGRYLPRSAREGSATTVDARERDFRCFPSPGEFAPVAGAEGWSFAPVTLEAKEGLALINGTQIMTAIGALALYDTGVLLQAAEIAGALSLEAQGGVLAAFDPRLTAVRNLEGQAEIAARLREYCAGSEIIGSPVNFGHLHSALAMLARADEAVTLGGAAVADGLTDAITQAIANLHSTIKLDLADHSRCTFKDVPDLSAILSESRRQVLGLLSQVEEAPLPQVVSHKARVALTSALEHLQLAIHESPLVQDDYSFRCMPQVLGCAERALRHVRSVFDVEMNSSNDNPLLFPPEPPEGWTAWLDGIAPDEVRTRYAGFLRANRQTGLDIGETVLSGGNFHGEPLAVTMDYLAICLAEIGSISERRIAHLLDDHHSRGLPPFLIASSGLNSGLMLPQYAAAALVSENKVLCHPASVDSIPTCDNVEDHVSMGTHAARKAAEVLSNVRTVVAIEVLTALQGLHFRLPARPGRRLRDVCVCFESLGITKIEADKVLAGDIQRITSHIAEGGLQRY